MKNKTTLAVIEGKWFRNQNISVRSLFDLISDLKFGSPHEYHYEMFNNAASLQEILGRLGSTDKVHNIYVAAHGSTDSITGSNEEDIGYIKVKNAIKQISESNGRLNSIYFGSCLFGTHENLSSFLFEGHGNKIRWVAGYTKEINFVKSSMLDMLFWDIYLNCEQGSPLSRIEFVTKTLKDQVGGLIDELGFKVLTRNLNKSYPIVELI